MRAHVSTLFALLTSGLVACGSGFLLSKSNGPYTASFGQALDCSGSPSARVEFQQNIIWGQSAYTIEAWVRPSTLPTVAKYIFATSVTAGGTFSLAIATNGNLEMIYPNTASCFISATLTALSVLNSTGRNYHVVGRVSDGAMATLSVDGIQVVSAVTFSGGISTCPLQSPAQLYIGNNYTLTSAFPGIIDDVRLTMGLSAQYPGFGYTVPTMPHSFDSNTQWLMRLDEGTIAGTVFTANPPASIQAYTGVMVESPFP